VDIDQILTILDMEINMGIQAGGYQQMLGELIGWIKQRPGCAEWMRYMRVEEDGADRILAKILLSNIEDMRQFSGDAMETIVRELTRGNDDVMYGICDKYNVAHEEMIKWITRWIDIPEPQENDPNKKKAWSQMNSVLDYYGRTGQFSLHLGARTKSKITYVDQVPWFPYAKFRFRKHRTHFRTRAVEADPMNPRPIGEYERYGFISSLETPVPTKDANGKAILASQEWIDWFAAHTIPLGFVATCAELPWKKVAVLPGIGFIYQHVPA
jgi:hypothetical protein